jgi:branched-chain amino acid transport system permease protein
MLDLLIAQIFNGMVIGLIYVLAAMSLSIVWGLMDIINFAHGLFFTIGAYIGYSVVSLTGSFWPCLLIVPLASGLIGMGFEFALLRRLYGQHILYQILLTFGIAIAGREIIILIYNPMPKAFSPPDVLKGAMSIAGMYFPRYRIFILFASLLLILIMWLFIEKTKYGSILRAGTEDSEMVSCLGVNISRVFLFVFGVAVAIAGLSGVLAAPMRATEANMGELILAICFAIVVLGGMGSFIGTVIGGLIAGLAQSLVVLVLPSASIIVIFLVMIAILLIRPRGLIGIR